MTGFSDIPPRLHAILNEQVYKKDLGMSEPIFGVENQGGLSLRMGHSVAEALHNAPDYKVILEGRTNRVKALSWFFGTFAARLAMRYGKIFSTEDGRGGALAFAPNKSPSFPALIGAGALCLPLYFGIRGAWRALVVGMHLERNRLDLAKKPHWYLLALGVTPEQQGQGIGDALLSEVIYRADTDEIPCYLEVFEESLVALYERKGFTVLKKSNLPYGLTLWCMMRKPEVPTYNSKISDVTGQFS